ncbi:MAG: heme ABC exporter ATP-binding protein CcmA [Gemmatimonadota bacterium]
MKPSQSALALGNVTRRYGRKWALRGVTLEVEPGEVVGIEGQNGSGKTTLLRIIATLLRPTSGRAMVLGHDVVRDGAAIRHQVGMMATQTGLYSELSARENLLFASTMMGCPSDGVAETLARVGLGSVADERVSSFSSGMQRRVALARLMLRAPRLLLLDEPYNSLDETGVALVNELVVEVSRAGGAALVVLHDKVPSAGMIDRWETLRSGRIEAAGVAAGEPAEVR